MTKNEREIFQRDLLVAISSLADAAQMKQPKANLNIARGAILQALELLNREEELE